MLTTICSFSLENNHLLNMSHNKLPPPVNRPYTTLMRTAIVEYFYNHSNVKSPHGLNHSPLSNSEWVNGNQRDLALRIMNVRGSNTPGPHIAFLISNFTKKALSPKVAKNRCKFTFLTQRLGTSQYSRSFHDVSRSFLNAESSFPYSNKRSGTGISLSSYSEWIVGGIFICV